MKDIYKSERINDDSYSDIKTLFKLCFGSVHSLNFIEQKYDTTSFGEKNIGVIAKSESGDLAAYYGVFPMILTYDSEDYLIAQSGDTMTAPSHRKKGLFVRLAKETYSLSKDLNIRLIFGFPNKNSFPGFERKLDWKFMGYMQKFSINSGGLPFCELASKYRKLSPIYKLFVEKRINKYKIGLNEIDYESFNYSIVKGEIKKDEVFFEYKLNRHNNFVVLLDGVQLLIKANTHLVIGALTKIEPEQTEKLIKNIKRLARRLCCSKVIFSLSENHWFYNMLLSHSSPSKGLPIGVYEMGDSIEPEQIQFTSADYDTF